MLHFLADEYDETSTTVFPLVTSVLATVGYAPCPLYICTLAILMLCLSQHKRAKKNSPQTPVSEPKRRFLSSTLEIVLQKMKWDPDDDPNDMDEDEKAAFEQMRKVRFPFLLSSHFCLCEVRSDAVHLSIRICDRSLTRFLRLMLS